MQSAWAKSANAIKSNVLGIASMTTAVFAIRGAVKTILAFEDAMAEVSTIVDTNVVNMHKLNAEILDLSTRVPKDAASLAQGLYQTISAGVTDVADAMIVLEASSKAATAGLTSTFVAVDAGTTIMNAYGKTVDDITAIQDVLFNTVKEGKTKYDALANSIGRAAPIAAQVGVSFEELTAAAATLTKGGLSTEEAMTSIRAIMVGILKPTTDAEILAKKLGLQFDSEALAAKGLGGFLEEVTEKTGGNTQAITALFGNVRALTGVMALAGKQADEFKRIIQSNTAAAGVMNEAFGKVNDTVTSQWQLFKNQFNKALIETGSVALPPVTKGLKEINTNLSERGLLEGILAIVAGMAGLKVPITEAAEAQKKLNQAFSGFVGPLLPKPPDSSDGGLDLSKELTENQKIILVIKNEILKAEKSSKLTMMAINQIEAERIANAKAAFSDQLIARTEILANSEALKISQDGVVSGMRDLGIAAKLVPTELAAMEIGFDAITGEVILVSAGTKQIADSLQDILNKTNLEVDASRNWENSTARVLNNLAGMARQLRNIRSLSPKTGLLSGLGKLAGIGVSLFNPILGAQILGGSNIVEGLGFQHGGEFKVGGSGGADSQMVAFRASPGERVKITPPGQSDQGSVTISPQFNISGGSFSRSEAEEISRPGLELVAESFKKAIAGRKIRRSDIDKAV